PAARSTPMPVAHGRDGWFAANGGHQIGKCRVSEHSYPPSPIAVQFDDTVNGMPMQLRSDGRGPYVNSANGVLTHVVPLMELYVGGHPYRRPRQSPDRSLSFDLSHPVPGGGARPLGIIRDSKAEIAVFYRKDPATDVILSPKEMAVGEAVSAARVE